MAVRRTAPKKKKPTVRLGPKSLDEKYMGPEPAEGSDLTDPTAMSKAAYWYSYFKDSKNAHDYALAYFKKVDPDFHKRLKKLQPRFFSSLTTLGWYCRLLDRGCTLSDNAYAWIDQAKSKIDDALDKQKRSLASETPRRTVKKVPLSELIVGIIEDEIESGAYPDEPIVDTLSARASNDSGDNRQPTLEDLSSVADHFRSLSEELTELVSVDQRKLAAYRKKIDSAMESIDDLSDTIETSPTPTRQKRLTRLEAELADLRQTMDSVDQLDEAYSHIDTKERKRLQRYVELVVERFGFQVKAVKAERAVTRKPRKARPVNADKMVKNMKWLVSDESLGLTSKPPADIVGAKSVWVFNVRYKTLSRWESDDGFTVSGSTLKGTSKSRTKTVRKPEEFFETFMKAPPKRREVLFDGLKTKEQSTASRLNENTLILVVEK